MNEDKSTRYHRLKRRAVVLSLAWAVLLLGAVLWTGVTISFRSAAEGAASAVVPARWVAEPTVVLYVVLLITAS